MKQGRRLWRWRRSSTAARGRRRPVGGVGLQIVRDWVLASTEGPDGLVDGKAPGQPSKLNDDQRGALARMVEDGPIPAIHGVVRWRLMDLAWWVHEEFRISLDETTVGRELRKLGFRKLSARPRHYAQNEAAEAFKKLSRSAWRSSRPAPGRIELWWQDEARVGQKNGITAVGADPGALGHQRISVPRGPGFRGDLPAEGRAWPRHAMVRHARDAEASQRDQREWRRTPTPS